MPAAADTSWPVLPAADAVGFNIHFTSAKPGEMQQIQAAGVKWLRMDLQWTATEKTAGQYDFSAYDTLAAAAKDAGLRLTLILDYGNPLYDNGQAPHTDAGRAAFAQWATAAVSHFKGRQIVWEMWNEPNGQTFWKPRNNVADYIKLAKVVGKSLRDAAPDEAFIGPALSTMDFPFMEACFKGGLLDYWSAVSVHPYRQGGPESAAGDYQKLRLMIARYAPAGKVIPIICSEWGYSSIWPSYDGDKQAKMLARQWLTNVSSGIAYSIWYDWHDDHANPKDAESNFGTVAFAFQKDNAAPYAIKPAYSAVKTFCTQLAGYTFNKRLILPSPDDMVLLFQNGDRLQIVAWTTGDPHAITLPASDGTFTATSFTGQPMPTLSAEKGALSIALNDAPVYLQPEKTNDFLAIAAAWERVPLDVIAAAPANMSVRTLVRNPTISPIETTTSDGKSVTIAPGQSVTIETAVTVLRSTVHKPVTFTLDLGGQSRFVQQAGLGALNAIDMNIVPTGEKSVSIQLLNPSGEAFTGTLHLSAVDSPGVSADAPVTLAAGEMEKFIPLTTTLPIPVQGTMVLGLTGTDGAAVSATKQAYSGALSSELGTGGWEVLPGGDPKVKADLSAVVAVPPEPSPAGNARVLKIDYRFEPGSKYLWLSAKNPKLRDIIGAPAALGFWLYGDASGNRPVVRFRDHTGQTFQPGLPPIDFKGWKYVTFPLADGSVFHFGGANDGVIHYPITLDTLFLLDTTHRQSVSAGTVYLTSPTLIWNAE